MKNILIFGPPRSGKTTLASLIVKNISCYSVINCDVLRDGLYKAFFKDVDKDEKKAKVKEVFPIIVDKMLDYYQNYYNPDLYYIFEGDILAVENNFEIYNKYEVEIIFVGMPNATVSDLFARIRKKSLEHGCWTDKYSDKELIERCKEFIEQSQKERKFAEKNGLTYLDTSFSLDCFSKYIEKLKT